MGITYNTTPEWIRDVYVPTMGIVTANLVFHVDAIRHSNTSPALADLSGNKNHVSLINAPTFNSANGYITLDGTSEYMTAPPSTAFNFADKDFTIELGAKMNDATTWGALFAQSNDVNGYSPLVIFKYNNTIRIYASSSGSAWDVLSDAMTISAPTYNTTNWMCMSLKRQEDTWMIYVNGVSANTTIASKGLYTATTNLKIGARPELGIDYSNCSISYVRVYNRALTDNEITTNFNALKGRYGL